MSKIIVLAFVFFLLGCVSSNKNTINISDSLQLRDLNISQLPVSSAELEAAQGFVALVKKHGQTRAVKLYCEENAKSNICQVFQRPPAKRLFPSITAGQSLGSKTTQKLLAAQKISELSDATVNDIIYGTKRLKAAQKKIVTQKLLAPGPCYKSSLYVGVASVWEINFPEEDATHYAMSLLHKAQACNNDELAHFAQYRLGIFNIWQKNCAGALPILEKSLGSTETFFQSRAVYWQSLCEAKLVNPAARTPAHFYRQFPLSLYPLLDVGGERFDAYATVKKNDEPNVTLRSKNDIAINQTLLVAESLLALKQKSLATGALDRLEFTQVQAQPAELQLYLAFLLDKAEFDLFKFQILSRLFQTNPKLKTESSMRLFYPERHRGTILGASGSIDPYLIMALIRQESAFNVNARSGKGARGLMQLMPSLARVYGLSSADIAMPERNVEIGVRYFRSLLKKYHNQIPMALAAYNAGPKMVDGWLKRYPTDDPILFVELMPFRETREYVAAILRNWYWYSNLYNDAEATVVPFVSVRK